MIKKVLLTQTC